MAETGHVTRAAEILNVVQPAVSRQLRLLEESMGAPLFVRKRHGMELTDAGETLVGYARRAMLELERARLEIGGTGAPELAGGLITLGLLPSTVDTIASAWVAAVAEKHPNIRVRIAVGYAGNLRQWLESGEVDAALLYESDSSPHIHSTPLLSEAMWVIGPPSAGFQAKRPIALANVVNQPLVLPSSPHGIRTLLEHACAVHRLGLQITLETNALSVQRALVLGGHGVTILPPIAVAEELKTQRVSGAPIGPPALERTITLALAANRTHARHIHLALGILEDEIRRAIHSGAWPYGRWVA